MVRELSWRNFDFILLGAVILASAFGTVMIRSAVAGNEVLLPLVTRQIYFAILGMTVIFVSHPLTNNAAESGVRGANSSYWPSINAAASYGMFNNTLKTLSVEDYNLSWGISLRWLLFDGFGREQQVQSAKVSRSNAELNLIQAEKDIAVEVKKAFLDLDAARKAWEVSEKALIAAGQDRRIAEERYNLGAGTLLDLLVASASYVRAEANRVNSIAGFLISKYNAEFVLGERSF